MFRDSAEKPRISDAFNGLRVLRANFINRLVQGSSVSFPIEVNEAPSRLRLWVIRFDGQCAVDRRDLLRIAPQEVITDGELLKREEVAWIQFDSALVDRKSVV